MWVHPLPFGTRIKCLMYYFLTGNLNGCRLLCMFLTNNLQQHSVFSASHCLLTEVIFDARGFNKKFLLNITLANGHIG